MNPTVTGDDYCWLVGREAEPWLRQAADDERPLVVQASRLRKHLTPGRTHLVLEQVALRRRARAKFTRSEAMFFTATGLEQSTGEAVAAYKASRFPAGALVGDLCCGIGGDLLGLAKRGDTVGVDRNPIVARLAEANLAALEIGQGSRSRSTVRSEDVEDFSVAEFSAWHLDPDRRAKRQRTVDLQHCEPGLSEIGRMLEERADAAVKLAPATAVPDSWARESELEWMSFRRECRQLVAWFGGLAVRPGRRRAVVLGSAVDPDPCRIRTLIDAQVGPAPLASRIGRYVFDPDSAVVAARLVATLALEHDLAQLGRHVAYLTGDRPTSDAAMATFEVTDLLPLDVKRLRRLLHARGVGRLEIKKRGMSYDLEALRRRLKLRGEHAATLLLAPQGSAITAILAQRQSY